MKKTIKSPHSTSVGMAAAIRNLLMDLIAPAVPAPIAEEKKTEPSDLGDEENGAQKAEASKEP